LPSRAKRREKLAQTSGQTSQEAGASVKVQVALVATPNVRAQNGSRCQRKRSSTEFSRPLGHFLFFRTASGKLTLIASTLHGRHSVVGKWGWVGKTEKQMYFLVFPEVSLAHTHSYCEL